MSFTSYSQQTNSFGPITRSRSRTTAVSETRYQQVNTASEDHYWGTQDYHGGGTEGVQFSAWPHARNDNYSSLQGPKYSENRAIAPADSIVSAMQYAHIVHNASQNDLFQHKNGAYMQVFDAYTRVKAERDAIKKLNEDLTAAVGSSLRNTISSPLAPISDSNKENTLLAADYPAIKYWKKKTYTTTVDEKKDEGNILKVNNGKPQRGKTRLAETGENVSMDYIETLDGKSIDGTTASSIRAYLRSLFIELNNDALKGGNPMPASWGASCASMRDSILLRLYAKYPYIRYCQDDWKADYLLSRSYSTWRSGEKKKAGKVKLEPTKAEDVKPFSANSGPATSKRERSPTTPDADDIYSSLSRKKSRIDIASTPPHQAPDAPVANVTPSPQTSTGANLSTHPAANAASAHNDPMIDSQVVTSLTPYLALESAPSAGHMDRLAPALDKMTSKTLSPSADLAPSTTGEPPSTVINTNIKATTAVEVTPMASAATCALAEPMSAIVVAKPTPIVNPLDTLFGPPTGPSTRIDALARMSEKTIAPDPTSTNEIATVTATSNLVLKDAPVVGMKRVTGSTSAKNLCYIAYLENHQAVSSAAFDDYYRKLPKDEVKNWNSKSKLAKLKPA